MARTIPGHLPLAFGEAAFWIIGTLVVGEVVFFAGCCVFLS